MIPEEERIYYSDDDECGAPFFDEDNPDAEVDDTIYPFLYEGYVDDVEEEE